MQVKTLDLAKVETFGISVGTTESDIFYRIAKIFEKYRNTDTEVWWELVFFQYFFIYLFGFFAEPFERHFEGICKNFNHLMAFQSILKALKSKRAGRLRVFFSTEFKIPNTEYRKFKILPKYQILKVGEKNTARFLPTMPTSVDLEKASFRSTCNNTRNVF